MNPEEIKLPELEKSVLTSNQYLRWEWRMDPPWIMSKFSDKIKIDIYRAKLKHLGELASVESQFYGEISEIMSKHFK